LSRRDNHQSAATVKMSFLIVAAFPSRLSRYTLKHHLCKNVSTPIAEDQPLIRRNGDAAI
jgi:hypothetical protein